MNNSDDIDVEAANLLSKRYENLKNLKILMKFDLNMDDEKISFVYKAIQTARFNFVFY